MSQVTYESPASVISAPSADGTVLLNVESGEYHFLNESGELIFDALAKGGSIDDAVAAVVREYAVEADRARADCDELVTALVGRGLLTAS